MRTAPVANGGSLTPLPSPRSVPGPTLARAALGVSGWNALSRLSGFVRVLAVGGAVGTTFLGNTYQSANLVSTVIFELLAAGLLSAPLVPAFVKLLDADRVDEAEGLAGSLLGVALVGLGGLALLLAGGGQLVMRVLTVGVADPAVRDAEVRLGAFLLWFFLPQMLLYAAGAVATALLNAQRRFAAAAFAPLVNNLVVVATMAAFVVVRRGEPPTLELEVVPRLVLAVGTTAGVLAMTVVPLVALARTGLTLRPRFSFSDPSFRAVAREGRWVAAVLAGAQVLIGVTLVLSNQVPGGVVAYQIAFTFFLLPFALIAHPVLTVLHPRLSTHAAAEQWDDFTADVADAVRRVLLVVIPAGAVLAVLGGPALRLARFGALDGRGAELVARVLAAYALGLGGYAVFQLLARASTAAGNARLPALVGLGVAGVGALLMVAASALVSGSDQVVVLGLVHSLVVTAGAAGLFALLRRRLGRPLHVGATLARAVALAAAAGVVALVGVRLFDIGGRLGAAVDLAVAGPAAGVTAGALFLLFRRADSASPAELENP
ncbi:MAG: lipid II flippase MurJ [Acidimicrobiales bacterium]